MHLKLYSSYNMITNMKKLDWKKIAFDAIKAALAVVIGALAGSCTVYHLGITSVNIPDSTFVQKVDSII